MTDYALIHERKEARRCGTPGVCIHHEYQHISKDVMQDILENMHIHALQKNSSIRDIHRMVHEPMAESVHAAREMLCFRNTYM